MKNVARGLGVLAVIIVVIPLFLTIAVIPSTVLPNWFQRLFLSTGFGSVLDFAAFAALVLATIAAFASDSRTTIALARFAALVLTTIAAFLAGGKGITIAALIICAVVFQEEVFFAAPEPVFWLAVVLFGLAIFVLFLPYLINMVNVVKGWLADRREIEERRHQETLAAIRELGKSAGAKE